MPRAFQPSASLATSAVSPEMTVEFGAARTATETFWEPLTASSRSTAAWFSSTVAIAPVPAILPSRAERRQMTRTPSSSDSAPATTAAATSPMEWPMTPAGSTPWARQVAARAICMANRTGCTRAHPVTGSPVRTMSRTENPASPEMRGSTSVRAAAKAGSCFSRPRPIPGHCEPCPENTHTGCRRGGDALGPGDHCGMCAAGREGVQGVDYVMARTARPPQDVPVPPRVAGPGCGRRRAAARRAVALQPVRQAPGGGRQDGWRSGRDQDHFGCGRRVRSGPRGLRRCRFQQDVGVGAGESEGGDGGQSRCCHRPGSQRGGDVEAGFFRVDGRVPADEVEIGGDECVLEAQYDLDESGDPGGGFQVAEVGLDRSQGALDPAGAVHPCQAGELDRVAERRSRSVCLDQSHLARIDPGPGQGLFEECLLGGGGGCGQAVGAAVLVDRRAADDREDAVAVPLGVGEAFEDGGGAALAAHEAVRSGIEGVAPSRRGEHSHPGEGQGRPGTEHECDAGGQSDVAFAVEQCLAGQMERDERGRAGCVDRHAGAVQPQQIGDPAGRDAVPVGQDGPFQFLGLPGEPVHVVVVAEAGEDTGLGVGQPARWYPGMFQCLPCHFQQQPVLRVEHVRLSAGDAEEVRVEA